MPRSAQRDLTFSRRDTGQQYQPRAVLHRETSRKSGSLHRTVGTTYNSSRWSSRSKSNSFISRNHDESSNNNKTQIEILHLGPRKTATTTIQPNGSQPTFYSNLVGPRFLCLSGKGHRPLVHDYVSEPDLSSPHTVHLSNTTKLQPNVPTNKKKKKQERFTLTIATRPYPSGTKPLSHTSNKNVSRGKMLFLVAKHSFHSFIYRRHTCNIS
jgi:hypothetical protein